MSILIEKPVYFANQHSPGHSWPWLLSLAIHIVLLLLALAMARPAANGAQPLMQISLLAPQAESNEPAVLRQPSLIPARPVLRQQAAIPARQTPQQPLPSNSKAAASNPGNYVEDALPGQDNMSGSSIMPGPYEAGQVDITPVLIQRVEPVYPQAARRRGIEGWVEVRFLVDQSGQVRQEQITRAQPNGVFENSVLTALRAWRFSPGRIQGRTVDTWMVQVMRFRLKG